CRFLRRALIAREPALSARPAAAAAASNWSVTFAMAETTTIAESPFFLRPATIAAVRSIALASSTEVPPNFITTSCSRATLKPAPPDPVLPELPPCPACPCAPESQRSIQQLQPRRESCCAIAQQTSSPAADTRADGPLSQPCRARACGPAVAEDGPPRHRTPPAAQEPSAGVAHAAEQSRP